MKGEKPKKNIAILGATGHIAKGLIYNYGRNSNNTLFLFARSTDQLNLFIRNHSAGNNIVCEYSDFGKHDYNLVINCIGAGTPERVEQMGKSLFGVNLFYDNLIINYLENNPGTGYFYMSSGVVHLPHLAKYCKADFNTDSGISGVDLSDIYAYTKISTEKKHRSLNHLHIIDIRVFAYFSRFINLNSKFLITSLINCALDNSTLITSSQNIIRDYIHPNDLYSLIEYFTDLSAPNMAVDVYSKKPVTKFELLDFFKNTYHLNYSISETFSVKNPTGEKDEFYPRNTELIQIENIPQFSSLQSIELEMRELIKQPLFNIK